MCVLSFESYVDVLCYLVCFLLVVVGCVYVGGDVVVVLFVVVVWIVWVRGVRLIF